MPKVIVPTPLPERQQLTDAETLGKFIRARRTQAGLGIHEAAAFCGVSVDTMSRIEKATGDVRLSTALRVCKMMGVVLTIEAGGCR
jgi:transcriptional regulator with XRE-family HTH domain